MPTNVNSVAVIEEAFEALEALEAACDAIVEKPFEPKLPDQIKAIRGTLTGLMEETQRSRVNRYLPRG